MNQHVQQHTMQLMLTINARDQSRHQQRDKKVLRIENKTEIDNVQKYASLRKS